MPLNMQVIPPEKKRTKKAEKVEKSTSEPKIHFVQKVVGGDTYLVMAKANIELEDEYGGLYYTQSGINNILMQPPFPPRMLLNLVQTNNVLNQCVQAMEVNVDGTGYDFVKADPDGPDGDKEELKKLKSIFGEPYPNVSSVAIRRKLRQQVESVGYSYIEVLRNMAGEIMGWRNVDTHNIRLVKLDDPVLVSKSISRDGKDVTMQYWERERRFAQRIAATTLIYYREFGSSRDLNRESGAWGSKGSIPADKLATELIVVGLIPDTETAYWLPRWINQLPSVVGSRKAEEQNLQFLDSGGLPPAIIFVQGGTLAKDAADQLRMYLSGANKEKNRAVVVEAQSSSGSLEAAGSVQVKVERFGSEATKDAMFQNYDKNTEEHVRVGFRLPPLFLGRAQDYNFATAVTAYMVAEAQVFQPERDLFDELMNMTIVKDLGIRTWKLKSKPITLKDIASALTALGVAATAAIATPETLVDAINDLTGMKLEPQEEPPPPTPEQLQNGMAAATPPPPRGQAVKPEFKGGKPPTALPNPAGTGGSLHAAVTDGGGKPLPFKKKTAGELIDLAHDYIAAKGLSRSKKVASEDEIQVLKEEVDNLHPDDRQNLDRLLAAYTFGETNETLQSIAATIQ